MENNQINNETEILIKKQNRLLKTIIIINILVFILIGFFCLKVSSIAKSFDKIATKIEFLDVENINNSIKQIGDSLEIVNNSLQTLNTISKTLNTLTTNTSSLGSLFNLKETENPKEEIQNNDVLITENNENESIKNEEVQILNDLINLFEKETQTPEENDSAEKSVQENSNEILDMFSNILGNY